jgi:light-regulated signal transduction histidine kinase (bacteriophytochrome)
MGSLVREVITELSAQPWGKNIIVTINELEPATGEPGLIRQVWHNLLSNAIKFSREKTPPRITIGSFKEKEEVIYYVCDQGIGFDMKYADTIFEVFTRLSPSQITEGTGVGLALVKRIILRHQGRIWVESEINEGTSFFFTLKGNYG